MAGLIDPTVTGNYPVILGDGLLGKTSSDIFTGIRYNHKPALPSDTSARLKPSVPGKTSSYDLTVNDSDGKYGFSGTRSTDDNQYVLYFDPDRKAFVLDKIDSTFNVNLSRTPGNSDPESLSRRYPQIDSEGKRKQTAQGASQDKDSSKRQSKPRAASPLAIPSSSAARRKSEKKQPEKGSSSSSLSRTGPSQSKAKPKPRKPAPEDDDEEEEDDDGGLLVEYPGAAPKSKPKDFSPAFTAVRRFDDFMDQRESEADDADAESDPEPDNDFKLPSPGFQQNRDSTNGDFHHERRGASSEPEPEHERMDVDQDDDDGDGGGASLAADDDDLDLEKDLADAFENIGNSPQGGAPADDESEISEED